MKPISMENLIKAVNGTALTGGNGTVSLVTTDSREIVPGSLFVCIPGEKADGHSFLGQALEKGAEAALLERLPETDIIRSWMEAGKTLIRVEKSEQALMDLAEDYLAQFDVLRIGVTGSVGKTSTKEMVAKILESRYRTVKTEGNHNNNIGLPLTVFRVDDSTEAVVLEMGMDRPGEIHGLAKIVRPDVALITTIGTSHMERLGSREAICDEKCTVTDFMDEAGTLIINDDNDLLKARSFGGTYHLVRVGTEGETMQVTDIKPYPGGVSFRITADGETQDFVLPLPGAHNALNAGLAAAAGLLAGIPLKESAKALSALEDTSGNRLSVKDEGAFSVIDDTYNASPESMKAAIDTLMLEGSGRKVAILGDMFELGDTEKELHGMVGNYAGRMGVDCLIAVGKNAMYIAAEYVQMRESSVCKYYETKEECIAELPELIRKGDTVLVKASRGMHLEEIIKALETIGKEKTE